MSQVLADRHHQVAIITLNRPEKLNAFIGSMREDLHGLLVELRADPEVRVVVVTGAGRAFCAGGDVRYMSDLRAQNNLSDFSRILDAANTVVRELISYPKLTIAAVNGIAAGGGANLALACDLRIGSMAAAFQQSFIKIGLGPDWGGSYVLPRIVGIDRARELLLTGRRVEAGEAMRLGLLHEMVQDEGFEGQVLERAEGLASLSGDAVAAVKGAVAVSSAGSLDSALEYERSAQIRCFLTPAAKESFKAFAKRSRGR